MSKFVKVAEVDDIPEGSFKPYNIKNQRFIIAHLDDGFYAVSDECTHDGAPISEGERYGDDIVCPRHGATFSLKTGEVKAPPAIVPIDTIDVKLEGKDILVLLD
jgi:3-phenylpropionate/trans-cinnamate dioxygenase ferredoxin subunit